MKYFSKKLVDKIGTKQYNISKFENANVNPFLDFLKILAICLRKKLEIKFKPEIFLWFIFLFKKVFFLTYIKKVVKVVHFYVFFPLFYGII